MIVGNTNEIMNTIKVILIGGIYSGKIYICRKYRDQESGGYISTIKFEIGSSYHTYDAHNICYYSTREILNGLKEGYYVDIRKAFLFLIGGMIFLLMRGSASLEAFISLMFLSFILIQSLRIYVE